MNTNIAALGTFAFTLPVPFLALPALLPAGILLAVCMIASCIFGMSLSTFNRG